MSKYLDWLSRTGWLIRAVPGGWERWIRPGFSMSGCTRGGYWERIA